MCAHACDAFHDISLHILQLPVNLYVYMHVYVCIDDVICHSRDAFLSFSKLRAHGQAILYVRMCMCDACAVCQSSECTSCVVLYWLPTLTVKKKPSKPCTHHDAYTNRHIFTRIGRLALSSYLHKHRKACTTFVWLFLFCQVKRSRADSKASRIMHT
jgi:hypothetical protein